MNPYEAPQTAELSTHRPWQELWRRWRETVLSGAAGLALAAVDIYYQEQERQAKRAKLVQQVTQQVEFQCPAEFRPFARP